MFLKHFLKIQVVHLNVTGIKVLGAEKLVQVINYLLGKGCLTEKLEKKQEHVCLKII